MDTAARHHTELPRISVGPFHRQRRGSSGTERLFRKRYAVLDRLRKAAGRLAIIFQLLSSRTGNKRCARVRRHSLPECLRAREHARPLRCRLRSTECRAVTEWKTNWTD